MIKQMLTLVTSTLRPTKYAISVILSKVTKTRTFFGRSERGMKSDIFTIAFIGTVHIVRGAGSM